jgi:hypothetical protein
MRRAGSAVTRIGRAWRVLPPERRLAGLAAIGLFLTLFLPWYQETVIAGGRRLESASASLTGWGAFSFVEAAVLLVAVSVIVLLFVRAEGAAFHVPWGDGGVITAAGLWTGVLIVWRIFDKSGTTGHAQYATTSGVEWGIFLALAVAVLLAYSGTRIRRAHDPEPPLPGERPPGADRPSVSRRNARRRAPRPRPTPQRAATSEIRPHRPRVERDRASSRGLNFSDLDEIRFDDPPEVPTVRRRTPIPEDLVTFRPAGRPTPESEPGPEPEDDPTLRLRDDPTLRLGGDPTVRLGGDPTVRLGDDPTLPLGDDPTLPLGGDPTVRVQRKTGRAQPEPGRRTNEK